MVHQEETSNVAFTGERHNGMTTTQLRRVAWNEFLRPLRADEGPVTPERQAMFDKGKARHAVIERMIGEAHLVEQEQVYRDPQLPFEIAYHPDILRQETSLDGSIITYIYEIKPLIWFLKNRVYCEAQASGYAHFTGAVDTTMVLYHFIVPGDETLMSLSALPLRRIPWADLLPTVKHAWALMNP